MIVLRIGGAVICLTILLIWSPSPLVSWASLPFSSWLRWLGILGGFTAAVLLIWMFRSLGMNITDTMVTHHDHTLIKNGLYRWIRHHLYTIGGLLFFCLNLVTSI